MKTYNRKLKKWVEEEKPVGSLKKPETCRGGRPHEFELALPKHVNSNHLFTQKEIAEYYKIGEAKAKADNKFDEKLRKLGIVYYGLKYRKDCYYFYQCKNCGKQKYD